VLVASTPNVRLFLASTRECLPRRSTWSTAEVPASMLGKVNAGASGGAGNTCGAAGAAAALENAVSFLKIGVSPGVSRRGRAMRCQSTGLGDRAGGACCPALRVAGLGANARSGVGGKGSAERQPCRGAGADSIIAEHVQTRTKTGPPAADAADKGSSHEHEHKGDEDEELDDAKEHLEGIGVGCQERANGTDPEVR
jgi:hypothetical protein